jgi:cell division transport system permease protein
MIAHFFYLIKECWLNFRRQGLMAIASISTAAISLTILGIFAVLAFQVYALLDGVPRQMEVHAFLRADAPRERAQAMAAEIRTFPGVTHVTLVTKEQAWAEFRQRTPQKDVLDGFTENPFPDKLDVRAATPQQTLDVAERIRAFSAVDKVNEGREVIHQLLTIFNVMRMVGIVLGLVLSLGAAALVSNTIRMTLFARRRDIRVMQLVGATNGFIRFPFVLEGMLEGALGGALACAALVGVVHYYTGQVLPKLPLLNQYALPVDLSLLCAILVAGGATIGIAGSLFSLRKFLHVA